MIIITDCLTEKVDEGCLKVANSLTKRIKKNNPQTVVISYGRKSSDTDIYLKLNKLFLNKTLFDEISKHKGNILYIPFSSNTLASIVRTCILSLVCKRKVSVLFALRHSMNKISEFLLRHSKFHIVTLSRKSFDFYNVRVPERVLYLKTGVDTNKFCPVDIEKKIELRKKYKLNIDRPIVLHVGHLHSGRNVEILSEITEDKQVILVVSSVSEQDMELRIRLEKQKNIRIIDSYVPEIQELYQLSDAYIFPVIKEENCIDVPLSVLEAASCNIPIVTTAYGELKEFIGQKGFVFLEFLKPEIINNELDKMLRQSKCDNRNVVKSYDWEASVNNIEFWVRR